MLWVRIKIVNVLHLVDPPQLLPTKLRVLFIALTDRYARRGNTKPVNLLSIQLFIGVQLHPDQKLNQPADEKGTEKPHGHSKIAKLFCSLRSA